jgi:hypothetical protein
VLDVDGDHDRIEPCQRDLVKIAPIAKLPHGLAICGAGVAITNLGREELKEAKPSFLASVKKHLGDRPKAGDDWLRIAGNKIAIWHENGAKMAGIEYPIKGVMGYGCI